MKRAKLFVVPVLLGCLLLSGCCNPPKQFTDPRTPSGVQRPTLAACEAVRPTTCTFANGNVAQTMGRLIGECATYCQTPLSEDQKACNPVVRNPNTGTGVCEPEPLVEEPTYYFITCTNLSIACSCEE